MGRGPGVLSLDRACASRPGRRRCPTTDQAGDRLGGKSLSSGRHRRPAPADATKHLILSARVHPGTRAAPWSPTSATGCADGQIGESRGFLHASPSRAPSEVGGIRTGDRPRRQCQSSYMPGDFTQRGHPDVRARNDVFDKFLEGGRPRRPARQEGMVGQHKASADRTQPLELQTPDLRGLARDPGAVGPR